MLVIRKSFKHHIALSCKTLLIADAHSLMQIIKILHAIARDNTAEPMKKHY
jgi:hypothetical protein